jgi:hypothetical protein
MEENTEDGRIKDKSGCTKTKWRYETNEHKVKLEHGIATVRTNAKNDRLKPE